MARMSEPYEHPLQGEDHEAMCLRWARICRERAAETAFPYAERQFLAHAAWYEAEAAEARRAKSVSG